MRTRAVKRFLTTPLRMAEDYGMATKKKVAPPKTPEALKTIDDVPGSIFDANVVRAAAIRQLQEMEDRHNFNRGQYFQRALENWERNMNHGARSPVPQPPLMLHYRWVENIDDFGDGISNDPIITEGPDYVAEPYVPPVAAPLPKGIVAFGYDTDDGTGSYYVGPTNTVRPGTHAVKDGEEYVFVVLGRLGYLGHVKMWIPVGSQS